MTEMRMMERFNRYERGVFVLNSRNNLTSLTLTFTAHICVCTISTNKLLVFLISYRFAYNASLGTDFGAVSIWGCSLYSRGRFF